MKASKKLLIVDDQEDSLSLIKEIMTTSGYSVVETAVNGREALEKFKKIRPDLVLLDMLLPDISGEELTVKMLEIEKEAIILILTGVDDAELKERCLAKGAKGFLSKPLSLNELTTSIDDCFKKY